jgi:hypothetical protein
MAVRDHTAPARPSFLSLGDPFTASPAADLPAHGPQAQSQRPATFDDVALAHYALAQLWFEDERYRVAKARRSSAKPITWPLSPQFKEGLTMAMRCLEQYAKQLGVEREING